MKKNIVFILLLATFVLVFNLFRVSGDSMYPTLKHGDLGINLKLFHVKRFDIVTINKDMLMIKRVIGLPNEEITFKDNTLYVNGEIERQPFQINGKTNDFSIKLKENEYFVMGDNRENSADSRAFGAVKREEIVGKKV